MTTTDTSLSVPTPIQFQYPLTTKLVSTNYLLWKSQVIPILKGHGLLHHLDSSDSVTVTSAEPLPVTGSSPTSGAVTGTAAASSSSSQQASELSTRQDSLILAWLLSSLSPSVLSQAISCTLTADLWKLLSRLYSTRSQAKVMELQLKLHTLKKNSLDSTTYLAQFQSIADELRSIGTTVSEQDLVFSALAGLREEYNPLLTVLTSQTTSLSIADLHGHLTTYDARLDSQRASVAFLSQSDRSHPSLCDRALPLLPTPSSRPGNLRTGDVSPNGSQLLQSELAIPSCLHIL